jgi:aspartokinase
MIGIVRHQKERDKAAPLVVVSALSSVTGKLVAVAPSREEADKAATELRALYRSPSRGHDGHPSDSRNALIAEAKQESTS